MACVLGMAAARQTRRSRTLRPMPRNHGWPSAFPSAGRGTNFADRNLFCDARTRPGAAFVRNTTCVQGARPTSPDRKLQFIAFFFCGFSSAIANRTTDPLTAEIAADLGVSISSVALLASVLSFMYAAGQPFLGPAGDHFGKPRILKLAMWVCGFSVLASAFAPNFSTLLAIRPITGLAAGGIVPVGMAIIGDMYGPRDRQIALARFIMAAILGQIAGALLAGTLEQWIGWRGVLLVCAAIVLLAAAMVSIFLPSAPSDSGRKFNFAETRANYGRIFAMRRARFCFASPFFIGGLAFGSLPFIAPILQSQNNGGAREAGFIIAAFGTGALMLAVFLPFILRILQRPVMMLAGTAIAVASLIAYSLGAHWSLQVVLFGLFGFGFFMQHNSIQAEVSDLVPETRATAYAMHSLALFAGQAIGPAIYGQEIAAFGAQASLTINAVVIAVAGAVIGSYFYRYHKGRQA